jgi:formylglycine-generating enzyme required for sulfatase activity
MKGMRIVFQGCMFAVLGMVPMYGSWQGIVKWEDASGWQYVDVNWAWEYDRNWKYLPESGVWIYVFDTEPPVPEDFVLIPSGSFEMGDSFNEGEADELPVHTVYISAFYAQRTEVTKAQWDDVAGWAEMHSYDIHPASGWGKAANHPVCFVSWLECVKYANAKSEREGLTPVYTAGGSVFRTGESEPEINYAANGYRLPTEAEWEKAARGGLSGRRFPWGDEISHSQANYWSSSSYFYDISPTRGYHPTYNDGVRPYTSPVASFAENGYGLYDMAGNVWEWCGDWYSSSYYSTSPTTDPTGPSSSTARVYRGGGDAFGCRVSARYASCESEECESRGIGFRLARSE